MRLSRIFAVLALAAMLLPVLATTALAARGMYIGVEDDGSFTGKARNANRAFVATEHLRAGWVRVIVSWADVRGANAYSHRVPRRRRYNFHAYDGMVLRANRAHIGVQMVLAGPAPAWATPNHQKGVYYPNSGYYGEFARAAAKWFGSRVKRYSVWNEPNYISWLQPGGGAAESTYRALYEHGYANIKRANPHAQVLFGETSPYYEPRRAIAPLTFLRGVLCNGRCHLKADGVASHPYDFYHSPYYQYPGGDNVTIGTLGRLWSAVRGWALAGWLRTPSGHIPHLFLTEFGYLSSGGRRISDSTHARYLVDGFSEALGATGVDELVQYTLVPPRGRYAFFDMSILTSSWHRRAPYTALAEWALKEFRRGMIKVPHY